MSLCLSTAYEGIVIVFYFTYLIIIIHLCIITDNLIGYNDIQDSNMNIYNLYNSVKIHVLLF